MRISAVKLVLQQNRPICDVEPVHRLNVRWMSTTRGLKPLRTAVRLMLARMMVRLLARLLPIVEESVPSAHLCVMRVSPEEMAVRLERRTLQAKDGLNAMAEYHALTEITRLKTERLKAERLAKLVEESPPPTVKRMRKTKHSSSLEGGLPVE